LDPKGAANVFTSQMMALIALAQALIDTGVVRPEVLIESLQSQMDKHRRDGIDAQFAVPLAAMIRALKHEVAKSSRH